jgi:hypothetical protein
MWSMITSPKGMLCFPWALEKHSRETRDRIDCPPGGAEGNAREHDVTPIGALLESQAFDFRPFLEFVWFLRRPARAAPGRISTGARTAARDQAARESAPYRTAS